MKILILIFIFYVNFCTSQYTGEPKKPINPFPKKVRTGLIQYNNAGKYFKPLVETTEAKKPPTDRTYTVFAKPFPRLSEVRMDHQIVPDSPYFPMDTPEPHERRSRVKKVLPEYSLGLQRYKRSADNADDPKQVNTNAAKAKPLAPTSSQTKSLKSKASALRGTKAKDAKKLKTLPKVNNKNGTRNSKLRSKKRPSNGKGKKKGALSGNTGHLKRQSKNLKNKNVRPSMARSKKLKGSGHSTGQKKRGSIHKKLKGSRPQRGVSKIRNKKTKKQTSRNGTSKIGAPSKISPMKKPKGFRSRRLIASRDALIEEYPYTVSIQKDGNHWCAGALLNPRMIITTANCVWRSNSISRMRVRVGSRHTDRGGQVAKIQEVMKHPGWKLRKNPDNDVALALLDRNIKFSHGVHGVDLPNRVMMPPFDDVWVSSWGSERKDGIYDPHATQNLQVYYAKLMERDKCNNLTQRFGVSVTENFICLSQVGQRAPCTRDTGAPAVSDGVLWGMASWGIRKLCGTERFPAVFSYLASQTNMDFIANATHYLMAEERIYPFPDRYPINRAAPAAPSEDAMP